MEAPLLEDSYWGLPCGLSSSSCSILSLSPVLSQGSPVTFTLTMPQIKSIISPLPSSKSACHFACSISQGSDRSGIIEETEAQRGEPTWWRTHSDKNQSLLSICSLKSKALVFFLRAVCLCHRADTVPGILAPYLVVFLLHFAIRLPHSSFLVIFFSLGLSGAMRADVGTIRRHPSSHEVYSPGVPSCNTSIPTCSLF